MNEGTTAYRAGDKVKAGYKSGMYIGEVVEMTSAAKAAVRILAVAEHPAQGDLHHPLDGNVAFFHQRRALAYQEIALVPVAAMQPYEGEIEDYKASLRRALDEQLRELSQQPELWAKRSLQELEQLAKEYFPD